MNAISSGLESGPLVGVAGGEDRVGPVDPVTATAVGAAYGRLVKAKVYPYKKFRGKNFYEQKRIEVIYVIEQNTIVTVTIYVFYGKWVA